MAPAPACNRDEFPVMCDAAMVQVHVRDWAPGARDRR
jgi:hypothetical protein